MLWANVAERRVGSSIAPLGALAPPGGGRARAHRGQGQRNPAPSHPQLLSLYVRVSIEGRCSHQTPAKRPLSLPPEAGMFARWPRRCRTRLLSRTLSAVRAGLLSASCLLTSLFSVRDVRSLK